MNIYFVSQSLNRDYDTYDAMVIVANTKKEAMEMSMKKGNSSSFYYDCWAPIENLKCGCVGKYIGRIKKPFCLLASFNAG